MGQTAWTPSQQVWPIYSELLMPNLQTTEINTELSKWYPLLDGAAVIDGRLTTGSSAFGNTTIQIFAEFLICLHDILYNICSDRGANCLAAVA